MAEARPRPKAGGRVQEGIVLEPLDLRELTREREALRETAERKLGLFREAFAAFAAGWMREAAKAVAVAQNQHTLSLGRKRIRALKLALDAHADRLPDSIAREFTAERYAVAPDLSSGQVRSAVARRFDQGIHAVLDTVYPLLEGYGYQPPEPPAAPDAKGKAGGRLARPGAIELAPDLKELIHGVADALTDMKVVESKMGCYELQKGREVAAELWETA